MDEHLLETRGEELDLIGGFLIALIVSRAVYVLLGKLYQKNDLKKKQKEVSYGEQPLP